MSKTQQSDDETEKLVGSIMIGLIVALLTMLFIFYVLAPALPEGVLIVIAILYAATSIQVVKDTTKHPITYSVESDFRIVECELSNKRAFFMGLLCPYTWLVDRINRGIRKTNC